MSGLGYLQGGDVGCVFFGGVQGNFIGFVVFFDGDGVFFVGGQLVVNEVVVKGCCVFVDQFVFFVICDGDVDVFFVEFISVGGQGVVEVVMGLGYVWCDGDVEFVFW